MKLIAIDLDDTLLREDLSVSDINIESINKAKALGYTVILASGRGPFSMRKYAKIIGVDSYIVSYNGAMVMDLKTDEIIYEKDVDEDVVEDVLKYTSKNDLAVQTYEYDTIVVSGENEYTDEDARLTSMGLRVEEDFSTYVKEHPPIKFVIPNSHGLLNRVQDDLKSLFGSRANVFFSKPIFLEVMDPSNNKYAGIKMVADHLGIDHSEIYAIGDSMNDYEMILESAFGIAMNNARDEIKAIADLVLDYTNEEDGVAHAIENILKRKQ